MTFTTIPGSRSNQVRNATGKVAISVSTEDAVSTARSISGIWSVRHILSGRRGRLCLYSLVKLKSDFKNTRIQT